MHTADEAAASNLPTELVESLLERPEGPTLDFK